MTGAFMSDAPAIDLGSSVSFADGHPVEQYRWLLEHDPVHWNPEPAGRGFWAVTRHADVKVIGRDSERFSSSEGMVITDLPRASLEHA